MQLSYILHLFYMYTGLSIFTNKGYSMAEYYLVSAAQGPQGIQGTSCILTGKVSSVVELPSTGNKIGTLYLDMSTGLGWLWTGNSFEDVGPLLGPPGAKGIQGIQGEQGIQAVSYTHLTLPTILLV